MKTSIRKIGNSKGIILPQAMIKACMITNEVNIEVEDRHIIISPIAEQKRKGWAEAFGKMAETGDDQLIIPDIFDEEDTNDWTWK